MIHNDPFDRLIMATAVTEGLTLVICDDKIRLYEDVKQEKFKEYLINKCRKEHFLNDGVSFSAFVFKV